MIYLVDIGVHVALSHVNALDVDVLNLVGRDVIDFFECLGCVRHLKDMLLSVQYFESAVLQLRIYNSYATLIDKYPTDRSPHSYIARMEPSFFVEHRFAEIRIFKISREYICSFYAYLGNHYIKTGVMRSEIQS